MIQMEVFNDIKQIIEVIIVYANKLISQIILKSIYYKDEDRKKSFKAIKFKS